MPLLGLDLLNFLAFHFHPFAEVVNCCNSSVVWVFLFKSVYACVSVCMCVCFLPGAFVYSYFLVLSMFFCVMLCESVMYIPWLIRH